MGQLLFEIGCEEIPAGYIRPALKNMSERIARDLNAQHLAHGDVKTFATPRRLGFVVEGIPEAQQDRSEEVIGPRWDICFKDGQPTKAGLGFSRKLGVDVEKLEKVETPKGECVRVVKDIKGRKSSEIISEILPELMAAIPFKKSMRWGSQRQAFTRPLHWIVAIFDGKVIPCEFAGVKSGNLSRGHRFMAPEEFEVKEAGSFFDHLKQAYVLADIDQRETFIRSEAERLASELGGHLNKPDALISEVANLVEYPVGQVGRIDDEFMRVPKEILINSMASHQRYFAVLEKDGNLLPRFVFFANIASKEPEVVSDGNRQVLRARLSDAQFFVDEDRKKTLESFTGRLKSITFQEKLGSYQDKIERMKKQLDFLTSKINGGGKSDAERALLLCKADLSTLVVYEFPDLQGVVGRIYADLDGEPGEVPTAIEEHYMPRGASDNVPQSKTGVIVSLADKIDSVAGCFGVGLVPSGTNDPYALRRAAMGILRTVIEHDLDLSISEWVDLALDTLSDKLTRDGAKVRADLLKFIDGRLRSMMMEKHPTDITDGVIAAGTDNVPQTVKKIEALSAFRHNELFTPLAGGFKRVMNILKDVTPGDKIDESLLSEDAERGLFDYYLKTHEAIEKDLDEAEFSKALEKIAGLKAPVDRFFDDVMVMVDDEKLRENRIALLGKLAGIFTRMADFRKIHTE